LDSSSVAGIHRHVKAHGNARLFVLLPHASLDAFGHLSQPLQRSISELSGGEERLFS